MTTTFKPSRPTKLSRYFIISGLNTEKGEKTTRVIATVGFGLYIAASAGSPANHEVTVALGITAAYLIYGLLLFCGQFDRWLRPVPRRIVSIILDQAFYGAVLYAAGELSAPFLFAPICMSLGAGLRYGRSYAVIAATASSVFMVAATMMSSYWQHQPTFANAYVCAASIIPFYIFRLTDVMELMLRTDFATNIANRRGYSENLDDLCITAQRDVTSAALIFVDLDGFKKINDEKGHAAGDIVIVAAAACLVSRLSPFGAPARIGGDEFAITVDKLENHAELENAVCKVLTEMREIGRRNNCTLSASIGLFYFSDELPVAQKFAEAAADELLFHSKNLGKNQCTTSTGRLFTAEGKLVPLEAKNHSDAIMV